MTMERSRRPRRRRNRMMTWTAVVVLVAAIVCAIAAGSAFAATKPTTVKIGVVLPLSGSSATAGQAAEHGAQLAVRQATRASSCRGDVWRRGRERHRGGGYSERRHRRGGD